MSQLCLNKENKSLLGAHFLWLSVRVIPWEETLKWTTVGAGGGLASRVLLVAFCTAWTPVRDSISTEPRYHTLQAAARANNQIQLILQMANNSRVSALRDTVQKKNY